MPFAFKRDAERVYEDVACANVECSGAELWRLLDGRMCNKAYQSALQDRFFNAKWNDGRESVASYAERLCSAAIALPSQITPHVLLIRAELPPRLRNQTVLVTGAFDEVVSAVSRLSSTKKTIEPVRQVNGK